MGACLSGLNHLAIFRMQARAILEKEFAEGGRLAHLQQTDLDTIVEISVEATGLFRGDPSFPVGALVDLMPSGAVAGSVGDASVVVWASPLVATPEVTVEGRILLGPPPRDEYRVDVSVLSFNETNLLLVAISQGCPPLLPCILTDPIGRQARLIQFPPEASALHSGNFTSADHHGEGTVLARRPGLPTAELHLRPAVERLLQSSKTQLLKHYWPSVVNSMLPPAAVTTLDLQRFFDETLADPSGFSVDRLIGMWSGFFVGKPAEASALEHPSSWYTFTMECRDAQSILLLAIEKCRRQSPSQDFFPNRFLPARSQHIPYLNTSSAQSELDLAFRTLAILPDLAAALDRRPDLLPWVNRRQEWHFGDSFTGVSTFNRRKVYATFRNREGDLVDSQLHLAAQALNIPFPEELKALIGEPPARVPTLITEDESQRRSFRAETIPGEDDSAVAGTPSRAASRAVTGASAQ